jgi:hypothetical protein
MICKNFKAKNQCMALCLFGASISFPLELTAAETSLIVNEGGPYHGDEIKATGGAGWLGLYQTDGGFELRKVSLNISMANDPVIDEQSDQKSGKLISVVPESKQKNIILIKPQKPIALKEGRVDGTLFDAGTVIYPGQSRIVKLGQNYYSLVGAGEAVLEPGFSEPMIKNYSLNLFFKDVSQLIFSEKEKLGHDGRPQVIWAGDLDRDGKLDLLLNLTRHYNETRLVLMLSSAKKTGRLLETIAELSTTGC